MVRLLTFISTILILESVYAQEESEKLVGLVTYESLIVTKSLRSVEWTNPNKQVEKLDFYEMPVPITASIKQLTFDFAKNNYGLESIWLNPKMIVIHSMDFASVRDALERSSFLDTIMPHSWGVLPKAGLLPNGAHFIIDINGDIYCLTPPIGKDSMSSYSQQEHKWFIRRHQDANPTAIGIENVTPVNGRFNDLSKEQVAANAKLCRMLLWMEDNSIEHVVSHHLFNDNDQFEKMLFKFGLNHRQKNYRTKGRHDVGNEMIDVINREINNYGYFVESKFH